MEQKAITELFMLKESRPILTEELSPRYQNALKEETELADQLKTSLTDDQKKVLDRIEELFFSMESEFELYGYIKGFKFAMRLAAESFYSESKN